MNDHITFKSSEHLYQYLKAKHHEEKDILSDILNAQTPREAKQLGDCIQVDPDTWAGDDGEQVRAMELTLNIKYLVCRVSRSFAPKQRQNIS